MSDTSGNTPGHQHDVGRYGSHFDFIRARHNAPTALSSTQRHRFATPYQVKFNPALPTTVCECPAEALSNLA